MIKTINKDGLTALNILGELAVIEKYGIKKIQMPCPKCGEKSLYAFSDIKKTYQEKLKVNHLNVKFNLQLQEMDKKNQRLKLPNGNTMSANEALSLLEEHDKQGEKNARKRHEQTGNL